MHTYIIIREYLHYSRIFVCILCLLYPYCLYTHQVLHSFVPPCHDSPREICRLGIFTIKLYTAIYRLLNCPIPWQPSSDNRTFYAVRLFTWMERKLTKRVTERIAYRGWVFIGTDTYITNIALCRDLSTHHLDG